MFDAPLQSYIYAASSVFLFTKWLSYTLSAHVWFICSFISQNYLDSVFFRVSFFFSTFTYIPSETGVSILLSFMPLLSLFHYACQDAIILLLKNKTYNIYIWSIKDPILYI